MRPANKDYILVRGARQHNLKGIDVDIPRNSLVVVSGPSGSGKSSLVLDTIYAESHRRYVESLSTSARQFLNPIEKPDVEYIDGLSPAVAIEQLKANRNFRSTVATLTEIYDFLRLLFAKVGKPFCTLCGRAITRHTVEQVVDFVLAMEKGLRVQILAPVQGEAKLHPGKILDRLRKEGYVRVRVNGEIFSIDDKIPIDRSVQTSIEAVVDRLVSGPEIAGRLADSLETALALSGGGLIVDVIEREQHFFSNKFECTNCDTGFEELEPRLFSFNSPQGACPTCKGLGTHTDLDPEKIVPDQDRSILEGAIAPWGVSGSRKLTRKLQDLAAHYKFDPSSPFRSIPKEAQHIILWGSGPDQPEFQGVIPALRKRSGEKSDRFSQTAVCPACSGARLRREALAVRIGDRNIGELVALTISQAHTYFGALNLDDAPQQVIGPILREIQDRLGFLLDVGVGYLTLDRAVSTLSGGEAQRIRLATQIGSRLSGLVYVLDEPSVGLHPRDNRCLIDTLCQLRDLGNTVLVIEHDRDMIRAADYLIDLGPGAGEAGGRIVAQGTPSVVAAEEASLTAQYLSGRKALRLPAENHHPKGMLKLKGARGHNLKSVDLSLPLGTFVCVTGVSGSGKSTLINRTLVPIIAGKLHGATEQPLDNDGVEGLDEIDKIIRIDQSAIGRTPRSNPATYTTLFTAVRELFAQLPEAKVRGYTSRRFSFNVKGGRCEVCEGEGVKRVEMHFMPDVYVTCEACNGKRYNRETLEIRYKGNSIADILDTTVDRSLVLFRDIPQLERKLRTLQEVGLGYIRLGQPATSLSGGEAQRVKLATELSRVDTGKTLYVLDEPTTGLHFEDIRVLLNLLDRLVDRGNTVVVIEHNLDVIKRADWVIDLGPDAGDAGGTVVAEGPPARIASVQSSHTGQFLKEVLAS